MILASAQTKPKRGDIRENLLDHCRMIQIASDNGADLIVFPELSITGYEREKADSLAFSINDSRLEPLLQMTADKNIIILAGAPIRVNADLFIGEFIIYPDHSIDIYTKQFLHPGEEEYYQSSFDYNPLLKVDNQRISLSICADLDQPIHAENASKVDSSIYISSIFFSPKGIPSAHKALSGYAQKYSMNVLMANFSGESWGQPSGGRSAFWNKDGSLVAQMNDSDSGLLIVENRQDVWSGQIIADL